MRTLKQKVIFGVILKKLLLLGVLIMLTACTSLRTVQNDPMHIQAELQKGDKVWIQTKQDEVKTLNVVKVTSDAILGESDKDKVLLKDIEQIEVKKIDPAKTALAGAGAAAGAYLAWVIVSLGFIAIALAPIL